MNKPTLETFPENSTQTPIVQLPVAQIIECCNVLHNAIPAEDVPDVFLLVKTCLMDHYPDDSPAAGLKQSMQLINSMQLIYKQAKRL